MPKIKPLDMESTFLLWLDCRELGMDGERLHRWFIDAAGLGLNPGFSFGRGGEGFMRLNFAVPYPLLEQAMEQLQSAYDMLESMKKI
jgi:cystathionine beta-lyase